jgi:polyhydroxybutyrate depolymerase
MIRGALVALATVAVGCSSGGAPADMGPPDMTPPTEGEILAERPYFPTVPANYDPAQQYPLVMVLAGFGGESSTTAAYLGFTQLAADEGIFLVTPDPDPLHARYSWNVNPDQFPEFDVLYLTAIIHDMESKYSIDPKRVYIAGHSQGAEMAQRMACNSADDVAGVISLAGQVDKDPADCAPTRPVTVVEIHGTNDSTLGYNGDVQNVPPDPSIPSAHETIGVWGRNDQCTGAIMATGMSYDLVLDLAGNETTVEAYGGCADGTAAELWTIQMGVHHPTLNTSFAPTTWGFVTAHPRQ